MHLLYSWARSTSLSNENSPFQKISKSSQLGEKFSVNFLVNCFLVPIPYHETVQNFCGKKEITPRNLLFMSANIFGDLRSESTLLILLEIILAITLYVVSAHHNMKYSLQSLFQLASPSSSHPKSGWGSMQSEGKKKSEMRKVGNWSSMKSLGSWSTHSMSDTDRFHIREEEKFWAML